MLPPCRTPTGQAGLQSGFLKCPRGAEPASSSVASYPAAGRSPRSSDLSERLAPLSLVLNSSVNSYRRLDPHFEAPNQIKASAIDRGSMVRIPLGNERSARVEVRSIAPDANPYLAIYTLLKTGLEGPQSEEEGDKRPRTRFLPDNVYDAIRLFKGSRFMQEADPTRLDAPRPELLGFEQQLYLRPRGRRDVRE